MKPNFILTAALTAFCLLSTTYSHAQIPQGFNYQAVLRDGGGDILASQPLTMRFTIHDATAAGTVLYQETRATTTTSEGLVNTVIGTGTIVSGNFTTIDWPSASKFLRVEVNATGSYVDLGTQQLMSVPYALAASNAPNSWSLTGNANTNENTQFIGTTDYVPLSFRVNNEKAGRIDVALSNTFLGHKSGNVNTTGYSNTAVGYSTLSFNTEGTSNTAIGDNALYSNTTGYNNTAIGRSALYFNTTGNSNTANGRGALVSNTTGNKNTANGYEALYDNTTGNNNTANGIDALSSNTTGYWNTASGASALSSNTIGFYNTANGYEALASNITGDFNTAIGKSADVSTGALFNTTAIGFIASVNASNKVRIGNTSVTVIEGQVAYSFPSDGRFKNNITESDVKGLEFIKLLRPVEYNFDTKKFEEFLTKNMPDSTKARHFEDTDFSASTAIRQSGFVAQEVEQAMEESGYNFNGVHAPADENDNYSVAYSLFVVPLVKGMQEQQMMIEELKLALEQSQNEKVQMQFDFETRLTSIENRLLNKEQR